MKLAALHSNSLMTRRYNLSRVIFEIGATYLYIEIKFKVHCQLGETYLKRITYFKNGTLLINFLIVRVRSICGYGVAYSNLCDSSLFTGTRKAGCSQTQIRSGSRYTNRRETPSVHLQVINWYLFYSIPQAWDSCFPITLVFQCYVCVSCSKLPDMNISNFFSKILTDNVEKNKQCFLFECFCFESDFM